MGIAGGGLNLWLGLFGPNISTISASHRPNIVRGPMRHFATIVVNFKPMPSM